MILALFASQAFGQIASLPATMQLRVINGITVPFQNGMPVPTFEKQHRPAVDLSGPWRKQRFAATPSISMGLRDSAGYAALVGEAADRFRPAYNDAAWATKFLPSVENELYGLDQRPEDYEDGVWYRRSFALPESLKTRFARLNFYAVNYVADVWLNGTYLGYHEGGYTPFSFDVTAALRFDSANVLAVRVDNPAWGSRNDIVPYGTKNHKPDWFNFTGIIHDVYLEFSEKLSIARLEAVPTLPGGSIDATVTLWNRTGALQHASVNVEVYEASVDSTNLQSEFSENLMGPLAASRTVNGLVVASDSALATRTSITIPSPKLWSPKHPNLYILKATVSAGGQAIDQMCVQFGIRTLAKAGNTVLLNGKAMFFPGVARHEDHYLYGRSVPKPVIFSDLQKVLDANATILRTAHYPNHPQTYLLADRLGIAVIEEIPVWWFDEWDAWFKQDVLRHIHEQMWREMVFRDRNRPSILFWSTCNECLDQSYRRNFIQRLNAEIDTQYPDGRFVTESAAADRPGPADPTQAECDVAGWTMYFGVFHGSTYYDGTKQFLQNALVSYPSLPVLDTEFGYWSREDLTSAPVQSKVFDSTFAAFNEFVAVDSTGVYHPGRPLAATTWWCLFDWFSIQTSNQTMGLYKMDHSTAKPVLARLRSAYAPFKRTSENVTVVAVEQQSHGLPTEMRLEQNYPNPFNGVSKFGFRISELGLVKMQVFDLLGREVAILVDREMAPGAYEVSWDASRVASGPYFYRLSVNARVITKSMLLIR